MPRIEKNMSLHTFEDTTKVEESGVDLRANQKRTQTKMKSLCHLAFLDA